MENVIIILVVVILLTVGVRSFVNRSKGKSSCCGGSSKTANTKTKTLDHVIETKTVFVEGMMCDHCSARVEKAIDKIEGASADVNWEKGKVLVSMSVEISDDEIRKAVENAGYTVTEIK